ncbi:helix-turn-helix transcriptional regulator [Rathayibacter sp. VKM Ac-2878]|nr:MULTISPECIES: AraC family transcriptional regulator [unclassified Rathayibacter]MBF4462627.1 helix-turn-helix transcriptional regulator [Rathayibacter sp. VKM Ac-2879]MBF4503330.1 helix-turn-helix transcriptional regulator [Rathayibacter sp. VKM Ac-2878]
MSHETTREVGFEPLVARSRTIHAPIAPIAYDCVKLIFVRDGSAILFSEFGEKPVKVGDVVALAANTLCGSDPEGSITVTTLYLDRDYIVDQVFWQHAALLADRLDAQDFTDELYSEPAQILHLGENRAGMLMPWLDELVALSIGGASSDRFFRMQALLFAVLDVTIPYVKSTSVRRTSSQRKTSRRPGPPSLRQFAPLRAEARQALELLRDRPDERWTLQDLASAVHLSPSQLGRVFVDAYGKTPMTYLSTVRAENLARLLRETDVPVEAAMRQVGWLSRGHASRIFREAVGVTPVRYRQLSRDKFRE